LRVDNLLGYGRGYARAGESRKTGWIYQGVEMKADQLAALLKRAISEGKYSSGDKLPSESQLSRTHGMSVHTVREALS